MKGEKVYIPFSQIISIIIVSVGLSFILICACEKQINEYINRKVDERMNTYIKEIVKYKK